MAQGVVADNWSLQDISSLFSGGFDRDYSSEIVLDNGGHSYRKISTALIQTEALFDFITDIVLRDEIIVDENFTYAWKNIDSPLLEASKFGVVRSYSFLSEPEKIAGPRDRIVDHLCTTDSLRRAHKKNVDEWGARGVTPDKLLSQTLWGGAGMCARSFVYEKGYTPHPLRRRLFINSGFMLPASDSLHQLKAFIRDERVKVARKIYGNDSMYSAHVNIPAVPIRIIQESSTAADLIKTALQLRDDFLPLREWLKMFQNAMGEDDAKKILGYRKQLDSVSKNIDKQIGYGSADKAFGMEAGVGIFKMSLNGNPLESVKTNLE